MNKIFKNVYIASDHAGFKLKQEVIKFLESASLVVKDFGPNSPDRCDYPDFAHALSRELLKAGDDTFGILICGTGLGMSMSANRHKGIRAALCPMEIYARAAREHNNANILCLGERVTATALAESIVKIFLTTEFAGGRHQNRVDLIELDKK